MEWQGTKLGGIRRTEGTLEFEQSDVFLRDNSIVGGYFIVNMKSLQVTDIPHEQRLISALLVSDLPNPVHAQSFQPIIHLDYN